MHFLNLGKKTIGVPKNSTQITGTVFSELKSEKKNIGLSENPGKMLFCQHFNMYRPVK